MRKMILKGEEKGLYWLKLEQSGEGGESGCRSTRSILNSVLSRKKAEPDQSVREVYVEMFFRVQPKLLRALDVI